MDSLDAGEENEEKGERSYICARRNNGLSIEPIAGVLRPWLGELLGLAFLTKALALQANCQWPDGDSPPGLTLGLGRDALGLSHLTLIDTVVRTTV